MPSRIEPRASRPSWARLCGSTLTSSWSTIIASLAARGPVSIRRKSNRWQRDATVNGILCGSVVASTNITCAGGSSSVFSKALKASVVSMCASSMMYTLTLSTAGRYFTRSRKSRISSMPRLEAASISIRSTAAPVPISTQLAQTPHGSAPLRSKQLIALARIRAVDALPVPRTPENRTACPNPPCSAGVRAVGALHDEQRSGPCRLHRATDSMSKLDTLESSLAKRFDNLGIGPHPNISSALDLFGQRIRDPSLERSGPHHHRHMARVLRELKRGHPSRGSRADDKDLLAREHRGVRDRVGVPDPSSAERRQARDPQPAGRHAGRE